MENTLLIGNDVEYILTKNDIPFSVIGLIGGSKDSPLPVTCGALQEDNVLAEINIHPASNSDEWEHNIGMVTSILSNRLREHGLSISRRTTAFYDESHLVHPLATNFGCDPDFNAWDAGSENPTPKLPEDRRGFRSAGGHVHFGIPGLDVNEKLYLTRLVDTVVGLQTVILDKDTSRKELYGKAGAMRFKPYGIEWRTPSNFWVFNRYNRNWMFEAAMFCLKNFRNDYLFKFVMDEVQKIINGNDINAAIMYLRSINSKIPIPLHKAI